MLPSAYRYCKAINTAKQLTTRHRRINTCKIVDGYIMTYSIFPIKAFTDNYIWAMHNNTHALVVDPGDAQPVLAFLAQYQLSLSHILITHHHFDHTGGIAELKAAFPEVIIYGPHNQKISGIDKPVTQNDNIHIDTLDVRFSVLQTPGHTLDHIVFVHPDFIFCGDTLFSGGCGRMFEGTPDVFSASLNKLAALPGNTKVYCTHEYTQANMAFALSVDKHNEALKDYSAWVDEKRAASQITLPSTIAKEREINPFLRCDNDDIRKSIFPEYLAIANTITKVQTFAVLRQLKDDF